MRLVLTERALGDLREAVTFIARDDSAAAARIAGRLREAAALLARFLIYRVTADRMTVLRIWHGARG